MTKSQIEIDTNERLEAIRREVGNFATMHRAVTSTAGLLETLQHTIQRYDDGATDSVNWTSIVDALEDAAVRMAPVCSATSQLRDLEHVLKVAGDQ